MHKENGVTLVALVVTIILLIILAGISMNTLIGDNGIITKAKQAKQNITLAGEAEAMQLNQLYYELETGGELTEDEESSKKDEMISLLQKQVEELQNQLVEKNTQIADLENQLSSMQTQLSKTNATADTLLKGYLAYSKGQLLTGTMPNNGSLNSSLNCGNSFKIPIGYTSGGTISANSLASQTVATATASHILSGQTAWINGNKITGNMANNATLNGTLNCGQAYTIPAGYTSGGKISANSLASQTTATATADNISSGKTAWVNGNFITGNGKDIQSSRSATITLTFSGQIYNRNGYVWQNVNGLPITVNLSENSATASCGWLQGSISCTVK